LSGTDQPLFIAQSGFHVGHERTWRAAEEQGFVREEGLERYLYDPHGLIPARFEADALGLQIWERGVDVATAVNVWSAILQRARGEDVYIVGGWRTLLAPRLIAAKGITRPEQLRGGSSIARETAGMGHITIVNALRSFGVGPDEIEWIKSPLTGYGNDSEAVDLLRSGKISFLALNGNRADRLIADGHPVVLDLDEFYQQQGLALPGRVIVATERTIEQRGAELRAFLRASLRGFWFTEDSRNHRLMYDLETRLRAATHNDDERRLRMLKSETPPPWTGLRLTTPMVMDGLVSRDALASIISEMVQLGELDTPMAVDDVLKDAASLDAFNDLQACGIIDPAVLEQWRRSRKGGRD
jgi:YD repeat-containing protein